MLHAVVVLTQENYLAVFQCLSHSDMLATLWSCSSVVLGLNQLATTCASNFIAAQAQRTEKALFTGNTEHFL